MAQDDVEDGIWDEFLQSSRMSLYLDGLDLCTTANENLSQSHVKVFRIGPQEDLHGIP